MILGTFLGILKIIGIVLLVILAVVLAILLIILFVPLRYRAKATIDKIDLDKLSELSDANDQDADQTIQEDRDSQSLDQGVNSGLEGGDIGGFAQSDPKSYVLDKVDAKVSFSWLLHLVRGGIGFPEDTSFWLKVLFFKILPKSKEKLKKQEEKQRRKEEKESQAKLQKAMENADDAQEIGPEDAKKTDSGNSSSDGMNTSDNQTGSGGKSASDYSARSNDKDSAGDPAGPNGNGTSGDPAGSKGNDTSDDPNGSKGNDTSGNSNGSDDKNSSDDQRGANSQNGSEDSEDVNNQEAKEGTQDNTESQDDKEDVDIFTFFDFVEIIVDLFEKVLDGLEKPGEAAEKAFYTISRAYDKMDLIKDLLESPTFDRAFECAKRDLYIVLRHIMPGTINADILLGIGDPASMGKILAGVSVVNTFNDYDIWLEPDFENKVVKADIDIKGRIALWRLLLSAARVYFNKDIRKVWKRFNRIMKK